MTDFLLFLPQGILSSFVSVPSLSSVAKHAYQGMYP